jgi:uncharacterized protein involved in type VI secretion and phage assembly
MTLLQSTAGNRAGKVVATAVVTANDDPEKRARVKLKYPWAEELGDSDWVRVATIGAGPGYGVYFVPEVGDEVLVTFVDADLARPFVIGALWNGRDNPPSGSEPQPALKQIVTKGGNSFILSDEEGKGGIVLTTAAGHKVTISDESGSEKISFVDKTGQNSLEIDSAGNEITLTAGVKVSMTAPTIEVAADADLTLTSNGTLTVQGTLVKIN